MTTLSPSFTAGGLASNLDTSSIIDGLVKLQQQPINMLRTQQSGLKSQVSALGGLASKLSALESAAKALGQDGVLGVKATSSNTAFSATPGTGAVAGSYDIKVDALATAAKARSSAFASGDTVRGGSLAITVDQQDYTTDAWEDGASLSEIAAAIRASGAPVSAVVLNDGTNSYLSITKLDSGFTAGTDPTQALLFHETTTGSEGHALAIPALADPPAAGSRVPQNASLEIDGLTFTRSSNVVTDALPGTALALKAQGGAAEALTLENDQGATKQKLQQFVDAYNAVVALVQGQLSPAQDTDRSSTLTGSATVRGLQQTLQSLTSQQVASGSVRSLADLGVKTNRDGSLTIDDSALSDAIARDPSAVDDLFSTSSTGMADVVGAAVESYVDPAQGLLVLAQQGLEKSVARMAEDAEKMQARIDSYRSTLVAQFTAMEQVVSQYKSIGTFLQNQSAAQSK